MIRGTSFLLVGAISFIIDASLYNILTYWNGTGPLFHYPMVAKIFSVIAASVASYFGSKFWTFRNSKRPMSVGQVLQFTAVNIGAILLQVLCLGFGRYILHQSSILSDNLWGTLIGQGVATVFRYITYGKWVFPEGSVETENE